METLKDLKERAMKWPGEYGQNAGNLIADAQYDLMFCQQKDLAAVCDDLRKSLLAIEADMKEEAKDPRSRCSAV